jgi:hypothetical protein
MENEKVSQGMPEEVTTTPGGTSLASAMAAVLKAFKPLEALAKTQNEAIARCNALWQTYTGLCQLPATSERALIERFLQTAESACLTWDEATQNANICRRNLARAEQELKQARAALNEAIKAVEGDASRQESNDLAAAKYMLMLVDRYRSQLSGEAKDPRQPQGELTADDEVALTRLRGAAVDFIATEILIHAKHEEVEPIASAVSLGSGIDRVPLPVRPLEEEIVRYLSSLENGLQHKQDNHRKAYPLLKERLALVARYKEWADAWSQALETARKNPRLELFCEALASVVMQLQTKSAKDDFARKYTYDNWFSKKPDELETHDRPTSTAVEKDQIAYLRKQMRVVAFNTAHRIEAEYALKQCKTGDVQVTPYGVHQCQSWEACLAWYEELRKERDQADLENLRRTTKADLLKSTVAHFTDKEKDEMTALYKTFSAMIPHNGPLPSNELRKLLDMAKWICKPLEKPEDRY